MDPPQINTSVGGPPVNGQNSAVESTSAMTPASTTNGHSNGHLGEPTSAIESNGVLPSLSSEKKVKGDGLPPKRRGPKPDSKPALTRRQELNRQAQRTHRERKELYIKALEQEVLKLKEAFGAVCRERDTATDENRQLKQLLASHGIDLPTGISAPTSHENASPHPAASIAPTVGSSPHVSTPHSTSTVRPSPNLNEPPVRNGPVDLDSIGIQFVLALEQPCMDHTQMLSVKSQDHDGPISGHALMATCPPPSHTERHPDIPYGHKMPDIPQSDLLRLLDLSNRLPLDGEITPVMAWAHIMRDERSKFLKDRDFASLKAELQSKIRCYGFGAVLEEFEVQDAIERVLRMNRDGEAAAPIGMAVSTNNIAQAVGS